MPQHEHRAFPSCSLVSRVAPSSWHPHFDNPNGRIKTFSVDYRRGTYTLDGSYSIQSVFKQKVVYHNSTTSTVICRSLCFRSCQQQINECHTCQGSHSGSSQPHSLLIHTASFHFYLIRPTVTTGIQHYRLLSREVLQLVNNNSIVAFVFLGVALPALSSSYNNIIFPCYLSSQVKAPPHFLSSSFPAFLHRTQ